MKEGYMVAGTILELYILGSQGPPAEIELSNFDLNNTACFSCSYVKIKKGNTVEFTLIFYLRAVIEIYSP